ncbi:carboxylating nicotinate-nucleotide diphosphorylase [candidate division KSB1 bacterium]|nr:carboxylating nicotinate-nucleotide diphosphorylase [candidate division KSB1 bacterium]
MNVLPENSEHLIDVALTEDLGGRGDITTQAIGEETDIRSAFIYAKQPGVVAGLAIVEKVFGIMDPSISISFLLNDGDAVETGQKIVGLKGPVNGILKAERTALNFLGRLSGIASITAEFVRQVKGTGAVVLDTRKTTPGWRFLEKYAVRCGGGQNHRMGLYDMFLIKENHITKAGGIELAVNQCRQYMKSRGFKAPIEVETVNLIQVRQALACRVDRIMLDNMDLELVRECVRVVNRRIPLEASGNVSLKNVRQIAQTGVDFISSGFVTHSARTLDISLLVE